MGAAVEFSFDPEVESAVLMAGVFGNSEFHVISLAGKRLFFDDQAALSVEDSGPVTAVVVSFRHIEVVFPGVFVGSGLVDFADAV